MRLFLPLVLLIGGPIVAGTPPSPWVDRVNPLGGQAGTAVEVELSGRYLSNTADVRFDCQDIEWVETVDASSGRVAGRLRIAAGAALGPHRVYLVTKDGRSNSRLFNVTQFPSTAEAEPNDLSHLAQAIELRSQVIQGGMEKLSDVDYYSFKATAGERWSFDLRSLEYGSHLENEMALLDEEGEEIAFNDDRDDYLETPFIEHVFERKGTYFLKLDQYRGPQRVNCAANCGYMLRVSQLPVIQAASPLGARAGSAARISIRGLSLESVTSVYLTAVRGAEYYRLTFPYSIPIRIGDEAPHGAEVPRLEGRILSRGSEEIEAEFKIPSTARVGLWRLWAAGKEGAVDGVSIEVSGVTEFAEGDFNRSEWRKDPVAINGSLDHEGENDAYTIQAKAGKPLRIQTLATQLGLPYIDTVLELFDSQGKLLAEHDDMMSGQGTVIGNPDSSLAYTPDKDETLRLVVRDRIGRGGPSFAYRLKIDSEKPGFRLLTDPENFNVARGGEADINVLLIRETGFEAAVDVWAEGLPEGLEAPQGRFRSDQFFGVSADGDNVIIPALRFRLKVPDDLELGSYPIRVLGKTGGDERIVEAYTTLWIGPPSKRNDIRRPLPRVSMTVVESFESRLASEEPSVRLPLGGSTALTLSASSIPEEAAIRLANAPEGVSLRILRRDAGRITVQFSAARDARLVESKVSVEALVAGRWAATAPIALTLTDTPRSASR